MLPKQRHVADEAVTRSALLKSAGVHQRRGGAGGFASGV